MKNCSVEWEVFLAYKNTRVNRKSAYDDRYTIQKINSSQKSYAHDFQTKIETN